MSIVGGCSVEEKREERNNDERTCRAANLRATSSDTVALSPDGRYLFAGTDGGPGGATGSGLLVRIPIHADGSAGKAALFAAGLGADDGLEVGPDGTVYFGDTYNSDVWAFSPDGSRRQLIASRDQFGDPLDNATSLVFLNGCLTRRSLASSSFSWARQMRRCETWWNMQVRQPSGERYVHATSPYWRRRLRRHVRR